MLDAFMSFASLGLTELLQDAGYELVGEATKSNSLADRLATDPAEVVIFDLDGSFRREGVTALARTHPAIKLIGISAASSQMQIYPPFHNGEHSTTELGSDELIAAVAAQGAT